MTSPFAQQQVSNGLQKESNLVECELVEGFDVD
jgi:hypothetical protein